MFRLRLPLLSYARLVAGALLLVGSAWSLIGLVVAMYSTTIDYSSSARVTGRVVELESYRSRKGGEGARPVIEYQVGDDAYRIKGIGRNPPADKVGDPIAVHVPTDDPAAGKVDSDAVRLLRVWPSAVLTMVLGFWGVFVLSLPKGPSVEVSPATALLALAWLAVLGIALFGSMGDAASWQFGPLNEYHFLRFLMIGAALGGAVGFLTGRHVAPPLIGFGVALFLTFLWLLSWSVLQALT